MVLKLDYFFLVYTLSKNAIRDSANRKNYIRALF